MEVEHQRRSQRLPVIKADEAKNNALGKLMQYSGYFHQSQKNPVSASAIPTRIFLRIRKVFVTCSLLAEEFPDNLENVGMI